MLMLAESDLNKITTIASDYKFVNDTKAILKYCFDSETTLDIVLQVSDRMKGKFMFAVFRAFGDTWHCLESGFHNDIKHIENYLLNKYLCADNAGKERVVSHAY